MIYGFLFYGKRKKTLLIVEILKFPNLSGKYFLWCKHLYFLINEESGS